MDLREHFNLVPEDLEEMLLDLFNRYEIEHSNFVMDNYFEPELFGTSLGLERSFEIVSTSR